MRILDNKNDKEINSVTLYLKLSEATELLDDLQRLIQNNSNDDHAHINDDDFNHEVTVVLYDESNLKGFNERSKRLILENI